MTNINSEEHFDPSFEISLKTVKEKAVKGVLSLTGRVLILKLIAFIASLFLWKILDPIHFGSFAIVSAIINFLSYFADIGLGAALIQKKEKPKTEDFNTVFTVQELLVTLICLIIILSSPFLIKTRGLSIESTHLLYALTAAFFLASLKNVPSLILERKMDFGKFVVPQIIEDLLYNVSLVYFAWQGFGLYSFTYAVLIRGVAGVVVIYMLQPWKPGFSFSKQSLKHLLGFGIPYQLNNFLATLKDDGLIIILGSVLGPTSLGFLSQAQKVSQYPLRFFLDTVTKVTFPAFSRMLDSKNELSLGISRSTFFICGLVFPSLVGIVVLFPVLISIFPAYEKWSPAYIPLIFLSANSAIGAFSSQFTNTLNAIGKIKTTFKLMVMWTVLSWGLIPWLSVHYGFVGAAQGYFLVSLSSFVVYFILKKSIDFDGYYAIGKPFLASVIMAVAMIIARSIMPFTLLNFALIVVIGSFTYAFALYFVVGGSLIVDVKKTFSSIFTR